MNVNHYSNFSQFGLRKDKDDSIELNFEKLYRTIVNLERLTLPFFDAQGNTLQVWKVKPSFLVGAVLNKECKLKIISGQKIRLLSRKTDPSIVIQKLESAPIKKWDIVYNPTDLSLDLWPPMIAGGKDWYIGHIEVEKSPYKDMNEEQLIEHLLATGFKYNGNQETGIGNYLNDDGVEVHIDYRTLGRYKEPNHVDVKINNVTTRYYYKDPYSTHLFKLRSQFKRSPRNREFIQSFEKTRTIAEKQFFELLQKTNLVKSFNATHSDRPAPKGGSGGDIGGVGLNVGIIEGLFNTPESLFENVHSFFVPMEHASKLPFSNRELGQILYELAVGIYAYDTVPIFSLHFDNEGNQFPVIHPIYAKTLIGEVFSMLDYHMKGYINGGTFTKAFIQKWSKNPAPIKDAKYLKHYIDFAKYSKLHLKDSDQAYISGLKIEKICEEEVLKGKEGNASAFKENRLLKDSTQCAQSFRIIAKQNKIQKVDSLFVLDGDFDLEYSIAPTSECKSLYDEHCKLHGQLPVAYHTLENAYVFMKRKMRNHLLKMPLFKKYIDLLNVINFFSYYFTTLKKHRKVPVLPKVKLKATGSPVLFPPVPSDYEEQFAAKGKKVMGGCGMNLSSLKIQPVANGEEWLNHLFAKINHAQPGKLIPFFDDQAPLSEGVAFSLAFMDLPFGIQYPHETEVLLTSMIGSYSSKMFFMNKILSHMAGNKKDQFIAEIHKQDCSSLRDLQNRSLLHHAALNTDSFYLETLLKLNYDPYALDSNEYAPIHYASMNGLIPQLKILLKLAPDLLNAKGYMCATPLIVGIQHQKFEIVQFLLSQKADTSCKLYDGYTPLHSAVHTGNLSIVKELLKRSKASINEMTREGGTPLIIACRNGDLPLINVLIQFGADPKIGATDGKTALDIAVLKDNYDLCKLMIQYCNLSFTTIENAIKKSSFEINCLLAKNSHYFQCENSLKDTPLIVAMRHANLPVAEYLLAIIKNDDWKKQNRLHESAIYFAALGGFYTIIEDLLKRDATVISVEDLFGLLLKGGYRGDNAFLKHIFNTAKLDQDQIYNLLFIALEAGNYLAITSVLAPKGIDLDLFQGPQGWSIEHYLAKWDAIFLLKKQSIDRQMLLSRDHEEKSLAYIAAENGSLRVLKYLVDEMVKAQHPFHNHYLDKHLFYGVLKSQNIEMIKFFIENIIDPNLISKPLDSEGTFAVHLAAKMKNQEILIYLHQAGANLSVLDFQEENALSYAVQYENILLIKYLINHSVEVTAKSILDATKSSLDEILVLLINNAPEAQKQMALMGAIFERNKKAFIKLTSLGLSSDFSSDALSPLIVAARNDQEEILELILSQVQNPQKFSFEGNTALHFACKRGNSPCIHLCMQNGFNLDQPNNKGQTPIDLAKRHLSALAALGIDSEEKKYKHFFSLLEKSIDSGDFSPIIKNINNWPLNTYFYIENKKGTLLHVMLKKCDVNRQLKIDVHKICSHPSFNPLLKDDEGNSYAHLMLEIGFDPTGEEVLNFETKNREGQTPLHFAAKHNSLEALSSLIKSEINLNPIDKYGRTPLFYAIEEDKKDYVKVFLEASSWINHKDHQFVTPLLLACKMGNYSIVRMLVEYGADINLRDDSNFLSPLEVALEENEEIALFLLYQGAHITHEMAHIASLSGKNSFLRLLAAKGKPLLSYNSKGEQPLHYAARRGKIKTLKQFHSLGIDMDSPVLDNGEEKVLALATPLHLACINSHVKTVKWFLDHGSNPEKSTKTINVLIGSVNNLPSNSKELLSFFQKYLLSNDLKQILPAIQIAISHDAIESVKILYQWGVPHHSLLENGMNGLHFASLHGSLHCTDFFIKHGVEVKTLNNTGETALELSAKNRSIDQFRYLVQSIQPDLNEQNIKGETLIHIAVKAGNFPHVVFLIDQGANFDIQDVQGQTPLFIAAKEGFKDILVFLMLWEAEVDLRTTFSSLSVEDVAKQEVKLIMQRISHLQAIAPKGSTPLHIAAQTDHILALRAISRHTQINKQNILGRTALHEAVQVNNCRNVRELICCGADIHIKDINGISPIDLATAGSKVAEVLQSVKLGMIDVENHFS